jgi:glutaminase
MRLLCESRMSAAQLAALWLKRILSAYQRYRVEHAIHAAERDLALTNRGIAELLEARRYLQTELMNLKAYRNTIQSA